jgi:hypothetical protein
MVLQTDHGKIAGKDIKKTVIRCMLWMSVCNDGQHGHGHHAYSSVVHALNDCAVILCRGIGWRVADEYLPSDFRQDTRRGAL